MEQAGGFDDHRARRQPGTAAHAECPAHGCRPRTVRYRVGYSHRSRTLLAAVWSVEIYKAMIREAKYPPDLSRAVRKR